MAKVDALTKDLTEVAEMAVNLDHFSQEEMEILADKVLQICVSHAQGNKARMEYLMKKLPHCFKVGA